MNNSHIIEDSNEYKSFTIQIHTNMFILKKTGSPCDFWGPMPFSIHTTGDLHSGYFVLLFRVLCKWQRAGATVAVTRLWSCIDNIVHSFSWVTVSHKIIGSHSHLISTRDLLITLTVENGNSISTNYLQSCAHVDKGKTEIIGFDVLRHDSVRQKIIRRLRISFIVVGLVFPLWMYITIPFSREFSTN